MKNITKLFGMTAIIAVVCLAMLGCPGTDDDEKSLPGTLTITSAGGTSIEGNQVNVGVQLFANYTGSREVTYQWRRDGVAILYATTQSIQANTAGRYTLVISARGYKSLSSSNTVTAVVPEGQSPMLDIAILVNNQPWVQNTLYDAGVTLTAVNRSVLSTGITATYSWSTGGQVVGSMPIFTTSATANSDFTLTVTANGFRDYTSPQIQVRAPAPPPPPVLAGSITVTRDGTELLPTTFETNTLLAVDDELLVTYTGSATGVTYEWWAAPFSATAFIGATLNTAVKIGEVAEGETFTVPQPSAEDVAANNWAVFGGGRNYFIVVKSGDSQLSAGPYRYTYVAPQLPTTGGTLTVFVNGEVLDFGRDILAGSQLTATFTQADIPSTVVLRYSFERQTTVTVEDVTSTVWVNVGTSLPDDYLPVTVSQPGSYRVVIGSFGYSQTPLLRQLTVIPGPPARLPGTLSLTYSRAGGPANETVTMWSSDSTWTELKPGDILTAAYSGSMTDLVWEWWVAPLNQGLGGTGPGSPWTRVEGATGNSYTLPQRTSPGDDNVGGFVPTTRLGRVYKVVIRNADGTMASALPSLPPGVGYTSSAENPTNTDHFRMTW